MSEPPADGLIRELILTGREAMPEEVDRIVHRLGTVPFDTRSVPVRAEHRGLSYSGRALEGRAESMLYHLLKRVTLEHQWAFGTTAAQYVDDLHHAVLDASARLAVFTRRGGHLAAAAASTEAVVPRERRGPRSLPELLVIYSADRGIIVSGYQVSDLSATGIPEEARWLK